MPANSQHETVLLNEAVNALLVEEQGFYIDATFGRGGHSSELLRRLGAAGSLLAIDRDPQAVKTANVLAQSDKRFQIVHAAFSQMEEIAAKQHEPGTINGILFDLGVSSPQLDEAERGFSFTNDGPLDMRMNPNEGFSAAQWINSACEKDIADVLYQLGEERHSRRMARAIIAARVEEEIVTTGKLAEIVKQANPAWEKGKHPATRAFQAIRIFINRELTELEAGLQQAHKLLKVGGRLVVISFHSLEDRIVKKFISVQTKGDSYPRDLPVPYDQLRPTLKSVGKPARAQTVEIQKNPRARSAIMRVAEKIA
ncbi:MAG: 16S rRNA (cytosine(1402)-N(4))-methyltransferase RsmH [Gammaproteobacteria bacterium]|jgi:16S rRNA (cytosine1402-N4)-methyltransferase|nr:16S rRNA (cytosine(1402)-N(4))-methyltransferase RsmH [Gammaproteobacteria bacterium]|tara:strand:+ start:1829 stop:2764 length:936 start_codon:yes stop_codon:yes gene_type:complete